MTKSPGEQLVGVRPRTVVMVVGIVLAVVVGLWILWLTRGVLVWLLVALFLASALNPAVDWLMAHGVRRRGAAVGLVVLAAVAGVVAVAATFVPQVVNDVNDFARAVPGYIDDLTTGRGRLGELERRYDLINTIREAVGSGGVSRLLGFSGQAIAIAQSVLNGIVAIVAIVFITIFMLLEGPDWAARAIDGLPEQHQERARRVGRELYATVGGYLLGNLAISVIAGTLAAGVLLMLGVPYALALALIVAVFDLVPLAGATIAAVLVSAVAFADSTRNGLVMIAFFLVYQQIENNVIQPFVYRRAVQLSPLVVLIAVLIGAKLAGVVGALFAIPIAAALNVILREWRDLRRNPIPETASPVAARGVD